MRQRLLKSLSANRRSAPQDGDRSGRFLRGQYWQRRQALERDVPAAQARLDEALARRNALR